MKQLSDSIHKILYNPGTDGKWKTCDHPEWGKGDTIKDSDITKVDIVTHSRGGLVAELYTMMYGNQYKSTMEYTYIDAYKKPRKKTITNIPRYANDINQIIMMGTPNKGSFRINFGYEHPWIARKFQELMKTPDPYLPAMEQQRSQGSDFMNYFWQNNLNPSVKYTNLAEDGILGGDGVVSANSARGIEKHQDLLTTKLRSEFANEKLLPVPHVDMYSSPYFKEQSIRELLKDAGLITANISISPESPVMEGKIQVTVTTSQPIPKAPRLGGRFYDQTLFNIQLSGEGSIWKGSLNIPKDKDNLAMFTYCNYFIEIPKNCEEESNCRIMVEIEITDGKTFLIDTEKPEVKFTTPKNGEVIIAEEVPYRANISADLYDPPVWGYASDIDPSTIRLDTPQGSFKQASAINNLDYGEYACSIVAKDNANEKGHDLKTSPYRWNFEIAPPIFVNIKPAWRNFTGSNESHTHVITITNKAKNKSFTANIEMRVVKTSGCLFVTKYPAKTLELPANSSGQTSFVITSGAELKPDDNLIHQIIVSIPGVKLSAIQYASGQNVVTDHPDESYDISDPNYPTPAKIDSEAEVGVYLNGFVDGVAHLLGRFKEPVWFVDSNFEPLPIGIEDGNQRSPQISQIINNANQRKSAQSTPPFRKLQDFKVLVIPSYGLSGVDSSEILKWKLRKYVEDGGVVVCWTQKYGQEFGFLPGTLTGYGANEDQSCWTNAAYIDEYHPIMAGQDSANLDCNADGYFTQWGDAKVILRRVKNQMPALVMYPYGKGFVVAAGLYPDWGYGHNQWSNDEAALVRDLITWAKQTTLEEIPETKPNGTISVQSTIHNSQSAIAKKVGIKVIDPDKKPLPPYTLDITPPLSQGQSRELTLDSSIIPSLSSLSKLGIYEIDYQLQDGQGNIIQFDTAGSQFAISEQYVNAQPLPDLSFSVTTPDEILVAESDITFPIHITNNGVQDKNITIDWDWTHDSPSPLGTFIVPTGKTIMIPCTKRNVYGRYGNVWRLWVRFYEGGRHLGEHSVGGIVITPSVDIKIETDTKPYTNNGKQININFTNKEKINHEFSANFKIFNPDNAVIFATMTSLTITANGSASLSYNFTLPTNAIEGIYILRAEANRGEKRIGLASGSFEVTHKLLAISTEIPAIIPNATNTSSFNISNVGFADVDGATLTVSFQDPENNLIWHGSHTLTTIPMADSITQRFDIPIPMIGFGTYTLNYTLSYNGKELSGKVELLCIAIVKVDLNKPSYRIRENLTGIVNIINPGRFKEDLNVITTIDDSNFSTVSNICVLPNQKEEFSFNSFIPSTLTAGWHFGTVSLQLGRSTIVKQFNFYIPLAKLNFDMPKTSYTTSEYISFRIVNDGGVDAGYDCGVKLVDSSFRVCKEENRNIVIKAGKSIEVGVDIPSQLVSGEYNLIVTGTGTMPVPFQKLIHIQGLQANMELATDKLNYSPCETITATAILKNTGLSNIENGTLSLKLAKRLNTISNGIVEFGFDEKGVINYGGYPGGRNLLDEFQMAIYTLTIGDKSIWLDDFEVKSKKLDENYYEVTGEYPVYGRTWDNDTYVMRKGTLSVISRYLLTKDKKYLDVWYHIDSDVYIDEARLSFFLDSRNIGVNIGYNTKWQMTHDWQTNFLGVFMSGWTSPCDMFSIGTKDSIGVMAMIPCIVEYEKSAPPRKMKKSALSIGNEKGNNDALSLRYSIGSIGVRVGGISCNTQDAVARIEIHGELKKETGELAGIAFSEEMPVSIAGVGSFTINIPASGTTKLTGKHYLIATLISNTGQVISRKTKEIDLEMPNKKVELRLKIDKAEGTITATCEISNGRGTIMDNLCLQVLLGTQTTIFNSGTFSLPAYGSRTFSISTIATTGILNAMIMQGTTTMAAVYEQIKEPNLDVKIETRDVVGRGTASMQITLLNTTNMPVKVNGRWQVGDNWNNLGTISLNALETRLIEANYWLPITSYRLDYATITLVLSGDVAGTYTKQVEFGELVDLAVKPDLVYPVGYLEVPFEVVNRGKLDSEFTATWTISAAETQKYKESPQKTQIIKKNPQIHQLPFWCKAMPKIVVKGQMSEGRSNERLKPELLKAPSLISYFSFPDDSITLASNFYVPSEGTITGSLVFELTDGEYDLGYEYFRGKGSSSFKVAKENIAKILDFEFSTLDCRFDVKVKNMGANKFNGELNLQTPFYQTKTTTNLDVGQIATYTFSLANGTQATMLSGSYTAIARILYDANEIARGNIAFELESEFEIQGLDGTVLMAGETGTITVGVKNIGNAMGEARMRVKLLDLIDEERTIWLVPQETGSVSFGLFIPTDFEDGSYTAVASLVSRVGTEVVQLVRIKGIKLIVEASLDKDVYEEGEMGTLTLTVTNLSDVALWTLNLSAKVKFNDYAATQTVTHESSTLFFFPIHHSGQKLNFGIYSSDNRAIWLDAIYVREKGILTIIPDKQIYHQGETVTLTVILQGSGTVSLTLLGEPATGTIEIGACGSKTFEFRLPPNMLTGTYFISAEFGMQNAECNIDVRGIEAVVKEASFDRDGYSFNEPLKIRLSMDVKEGFDGQVRAWIVDDRDNWVNIYEEDKVFANGRCVYEISGTTTMGRRQSLVYGIYLGTQTLVVSGRKEIGIYNIPYALGKTIEKNGLRVNILPDGLNKNALFDFYRVVEYPSPLQGIHPLDVFEFVIYTDNVDMQKSISVTYGLDGISDRIIKDSIKAYYIVESSPRPSPIRRESKEGNWVEITEQKKEGNQLAFCLPHLSLIGIAGRISKPLDEITTYPNPAKDKITFGDNLPSMIRVRIFNAAGEMVYEYEGASENGRWQWSLQNKNDEKVASGIYFYVLTTPEGETKTGKIGVVR